MFQQLVHLLVQDRLIQGVRHDRDKCVPIHVLTDQRQAVPRLIRGPRLPP